MQVDRIIAHFDLDSFFVSVEVLNNPSLKGKPVIVGGKDRGVVAACSYEARKYGIHSAMPSAKAKSLCADAVFLKGNTAEYSRYSRWVTDIIAADSPLFEKASIDEFYIDLTGMKRFFDPLQWTIDLRNKIMNQTGLPISFGLASSKTVAKMATNMAKPNGYLNVSPGKEKAFLYPLPVEAIPGVGEHTKVLLQSLGIFTIKQLAEMGEVALNNHLGKWGFDLWLKSQGLCQSEVGNYHEAKSLSTETTFEVSLKDEQELMKCILMQTEKVCYALRKEEKLTGCVTLKIRYADFETTTKQHSIPYTFADDDVIPVVKNLFRQLYTKEKPVRLTGIRLSDFVQSSFQTNLFCDFSKKSHLYKAIDDVKNRFGKTAVTRASSK